MSPALPDSPHLSAVRAFDDAELSAWLTRRTNASALASAGELAPFWLALMRGEARGIEADLERAFTQAANARDAHGVVEATALRALVALSLGKRSEGVAFARRAALMARSEAVPEGELLANLVLARARRHMGNPHLAVRILEAVGRHAPEFAEGWVSFERLLAGGLGAEPSAGAGSSPAARAVRAGQELLLAAHHGLRAEFERAAGELDQACAGFRDIQSEAQALVILLDFERICPERLQGFRHGESDELSYGLFGAGVLLSAEEPAVRIVAAARPGERGARILCDGLKLFGPNRLLSEGDEQRRAHGRTDAGLSVLVLHGPAPLAEEVFFPRVYGFAYSRQAHRGVFDVLVHRMRKRIAQSGNLVRAGGALRLELLEPIAVADPRCSPPAAARILSALARQPHATAEAIAARLGISVRGAQVALQQLVVEGACASRRRGRQLLYQLQDTTFSEPTGGDVLGSQAQQLP